MHSCYSTCVEVGRQLFSLLPCRLLGFNSSQQLWQQRPSPADLYLANPQYLNLKMMHLSIRLTSGWTCLACPLNRFKSTGSVPLCVSVRRAPERCSWGRETHPKCGQRSWTARQWAKHQQSSLIPDWRCNITSSLTVPTTSPAAVMGFILKPWATGNSSLL